MLCVVESFDPSTRFAIASYQIAIPSPHAVRSHPHRDLHGEKMDVSHEIPPSPAFSDRDSLAGIDDLDAFLDAQGKLSHWPTPPLRSELEEDLEVPSEDSEDESEDGIDGMQLVLQGYADPY